MPDFCMTFSSVVQLNKDIDEGINFQKIQCWILMKRESVNIYKSIHFQCNFNFHGLLLQVAGWSHAKICLSLLRKMLFAFKGIQTFR